MLFCLYCRMHAVALVVESFLFGLFVFAIGCDQVSRYLRSYCNQFFTCAQVRVPYCWLAIVNWRNLVAACFVRVCRYMLFLMMKLEWRMLRRSQARMRSTGQIASYWPTSLAEVCDGYLSIQSSIVIAKCTNDLWLTNMLVVWYFRTSVSLAVALPLAKIIYRTAQWSHCIVSMLLCCNV